MNKSKKFHGVQEYKGIKFTFFGVYGGGVRITIIPRNGGSDWQKILIPKVYFTEDCRLKEDVDVDFAFRTKAHQLELAGYYEPIRGIKKASNLRRRNETCNL